MSRICLTLLAALWLATPSALAESSDRPNIVLILADDLGFSDVGCYGGEIRTPHLDSLAAGGLRLTQFYNTGRCWPTRASILTGYYPHQVRRDKVPGVPSGGRGKRPGWAPLLPRLIAPLGYRSYHSGKWHVDGMPVAEGFDRSYYLRDQGRFFYPKVHYLDDNKLPAVQPGSGFYGTTAIADRAIEFLKQHQREHADAPFFHYIAFTAPHFPLHALPEDIAKYEGAYDRGWRESRQQRYQRQLGLGIVSTTLSAVERDLGPPYHFPEAFKILGPGEVSRPLPWDELTEQQQAFQATKMSLHAAMVDRIDQEVGRVIQQLKEMDAWENTLILFLSDNGASAEIMVRTDGHDPAAPPGSGPSYLCLGPGWSTTSNTPFRRHKTWVHEGGIATPLIAHWPRGIAARDELRHTPGHVIDLPPTILQLCGGEPAEMFAGSRRPPWPGRSMAPVLRGDLREQRTLWWLHEGNRAIRVGDWKLVAADQHPWELYDLRRDRAESNSLAESEPRRAAAMARQWTAMHDQFVKQAQGSQ